MTDTRQLRPRSLQTDRLDLRPPVDADLDALFAIQSDPQLWRHYPSLRATDPSRIRTEIERWRAGWERDGLGTWTVRLRDRAEVIGYGGCARRGEVWNLGYRLAAAAHGRGYATELARAAITQARLVAPDRPIVARLLEHNSGSQRVVVKLGMTLVSRTLDDGNPDPTAIRLIYADRDLSRAQAAALLG